MANVFPGKSKKAWAARAEMLAAWTWSRLVNRTDVWGGYWPEQTAEGERTRPTTRPHPRDRGRVLLTNRTLTNHFAADQTRWVVGLHTTSAGNTSRWGAVEVDWHGQSSSPAEINWAAALHWHEELRRLGFRPLLTDSNGQGGYHLLTIFAEPVPTARVFSFLKRLIREHVDRGLTSPPEIFPKQPAIMPGGFGNWLRLPGRHHTREHWSRVWDGGRWLDGPEAVSFILSIEGDRPGLLTPDMLAPAPLASPVYRTLCAPTHRYGPGPLSARICAYLGKLPAGLGVGQHRDDYAFQFATFLVRDLGLSDSDALAWLEEWDARNAVPKGARRLQEILNNAHAYGQRAYGAGLQSLAPVRRGKGRSTARAPIRFSVEI